MVGNSATALCRVGQLKKIVMDLWRKEYKHLLAFSRCIVFYISKLYFYIFINVCGSQIFSNPVTNAHFYLPVDIIAMLKNGCLLSI